MNTALSKLQLTEMALQRLPYFLEIEELQLALFLALTQQTSASLLIDVGANMGFYSLVISHYRPEIRGWAFEPNPESFTELSSNLAAQGCGRIVANRLALSSQVGTALFHDYGKCSGKNGLAATSFYSPEEQRRELEVATTTLDLELPDLLGERLMLKIDTEGHELEVLEGALKVLESNQVTVQVEAGHGLRGIFAQNLLLKLGYQQRFALGPDRIFSNLESHDEPMMLKDLLETAMDFIVRLRWDGDSQPRPTPQ